MSTPADAVLAAARARIGEVTSARYCATFVSQVFAAAGQGKVFGTSSSVAGIERHFSGAQVSSDLSTALPADLIVFGDDEHVMIYEGNGRVVGTATAAPTNPVGIAKGLVTKVCETEAAAVATDNHKPPAFSKVLHTGLYLSPTSTTGTIPKCGSSAAYHTVAEYLSIDGATIFDLHVEGLLIVKAVAVMGGASYGTAQYGNLLRGWYGDYAAQAKYRCDQIAFCADSDGKPLQGDIQTVLRSLPEYLGQSPANVWDWFTSIPGGALSGAGSLFGDIFAWVPSFALNAGILLFAAYLVWAGIKELAGEVE